MKKILILLVVVTSAWAYYKQLPKFETPKVITQDTAIDTYQTDYKCDGRQHCSQMNSYEEAKFFLQNCPNTKMDGDNDGEPCERQFGGY